MSLSQSATSQWGRGFDSGDLLFRSRIVGVVDVWRDFHSGDKTLSSTGAAGRRRWPEGQLSPRAGSMNPSQSATSQCVWGVHTVRSGIDPGDLLFRARLVRVVEIWKDL